MKPMSRLFISACAAALLFSQAPALAQVGTPALPVALAPIPEPRDQAYPGECLAWVGNHEDGKCLYYSNGSTTGGTPWGIYGPNNYTNGGLLPGQTFTGPVR